MEKKKLIEKLVPQIPELVIVNDITVILKNSNAFHEQNPFPVETTRCKQLTKTIEASVLLRNANESYPLIHEDLIPLIHDFINLKQQNGADIEKEVYKDMTLCSFIQRLLEKRPLMFVGARDRYVPRDDPERRLRGIGGFDKIGTPEEQEPIVMKEYLNYDEMKISALIATCSPTAVINKGNRKNIGRVSTDDSDHEKEAFIVGLVGTRFARKDDMESQEIRISKDQDLSKKFHGEQKGETLGSIFARFYDVPYFPTYEKVRKLFGPNLNSRLKKDDFFPIKSVQAGRFKTKKLKTMEYFNTNVYEKRIKLTAETFLLEANERARQAGKKAYVHVVGLGLGVWKLIQEQEKWYVDVFGKCLGSLTLEHVSDIDFSWIAVSDCCGFKDGQKFGDTGITVHISKRDMFDKLDDASKVVVTSWAYDGNSYPGNEYWSGSLHTSGDPQAACATQVPELHNPLVNPAFCGNNLRIATRKNGIVPIQEYLRLL